jgi:carboxymethylenebutenolidase
MAEQIRLNTSGMQCIGAYLAKPEGKPKGGIVVVQEIFGANAHIRQVTERFAAAGYTAIAPAFFDHIETNLELDYDPSAFARGKQLVAEVGIDRAVEDVASAADSIRSSGKIGVVGYCWGGTTALLAATRLALPAVSYYGARNVNFLDEKLRAPVQFHFGERDASIPPEAVQRHREAYPQMDIYTYPAGHAFNRDVDGTHYDAASADLARQRTLEFFAKHLATTTA